jgi:excisionase family DNA binding protein
MTLMDVARELQCSRHHVRALIDRGGLDFINIGTAEKRIPRISRAIFEKWLRARTERNSE